jgi:hypothetical protein
LAKAKKSTDTPESLQDKLIGEKEAAWQALTPLRNTWDEKEQALLARANDSFSGTVTRARVTDAALSTLAFERQARVAAQLPTGKVNPTARKEEGKAKIADIVLHRYIIPNANAQKPMLVKHRLWGVYASVYGSMPMFYDYRVDDDYIGPDCWLIDPRSYMPQPGRHSVQECDWVMVSTVVTIRDLKNIVKRKNTSWNVENIKKLIEVAKDGKPTRKGEADKTSQTESLRYTQDAVKGQIELVTKYEAGDDGHWITFAPDYKEVEILRDIPNPHKSGKIPVVMRDCFPLLNSIYGLGDFERGMKIQKAKDSLLGLRLEFVKNKVYPSMLVDMSKVTPSTVKYGAGTKIRTTDVNNSIKPLDYGNESESGFQNTFSVLNGIQQDQFGTSQASLSVDESANPQMGKTPAALNMQKAQENARDTWDRFHHEQAVEELYEGMINLLSVKMEKPINFSIFEEEIRQIQEDYGDDVLDVIAGGKMGLMTISKKHINSDKGFQYIIDANSSMQKDDQAQLDALMSTYQMLSQDPNLQAVLQQKGLNWDQAEHIKKILISSGVSDWERILQEGNEAGQGEIPGTEQYIDPETGQPVDPNMMQEEQVDPYAGIEQPQIPNFEDPHVQAYAQEMFGGGQPQ